jgi:hypothetical protein
MAAWMFAKANSFVNYCFSVIANGQTPLCEQVGQLVVQHHQRTCWALARPAPNKLYNLLGAGLARAQHLDRPEPSKLANKLAQWSISANKLYNKFVSGAPDTNLLANKLATCWPTCSYSGVWLYDDGAIRRI